MQLSDCHVATLLHTIQVLVNLDEIVVATTTSSSFLSFFDDDYII